MTSKYLALLLAATLVAAQPAVAGDTSAPAQAQTAAAGEQEDELNVTAGRMEVLLDGKTIELTDNVRFEDTTMILTASRMMIFLDDTEAPATASQPVPSAEKKDEEQNMKLKRIEAYNNVVLRKRLDPTESVMGDNAVYDAAGDIVTLTGNCVVTQQGRTLKGKEVVFDRTQQKINVKDVIFNLRLPKSGRKGLTGIFGEDKNKEKDKAKGKDKDAEQDNKQPAQP